MNATYERQIIGGIFSTCENADNAIEAFQALNISRHDILVIKLHGAQAVDAYTSFLVGRGFTHSQALYYDRAIQSGKILVTVYGVRDLALVIGIFSKYNAKYQLKNKQPYHLSLDTRHGSSAAVAAELSYGF